MPNREQSGWLQLCVCVCACTLTCMCVCVWERERKNNNHVSFYFTDMGWWTKEYSAADAAEMAIPILSHEENFVQCILWCYDHNTILYVSCWTTLCSVVLQIHPWSQNCRKHLKILLIVIALHWRLKKNNKARSMSYCAISDFLKNVYLQLPAFVQKDFKIFFITQTSNLFLLLLYFTSRLIQFRTLLPRS